MVKIAQTEQFTSVLVTVSNFRNPKDSNNKPKVGVCREAHPHVNFKFKSQFNETVRKTMEKTHTLFTRYYILFITVSLCCGFIACSSDEDDGEGNNDTIELIGKTFYNYDKSYGDMSEHVYHTNISFISPTLASIESWGYDYDFEYLEKIRFEWTKACKYRVDGNNIIMEKYPVFADGSNYTLKYKGDKLVGEDNLEYKLTKTNSDSAPSANFTSADIQGIWATDDTFDLGGLIPNLSQMGVYIVSGDNNAAKKLAKEHTADCLCFHTSSTAAYAEVGMFDNKKSGATTLRTVRFPDRSYMYLEDRHNKTYEYYIDGSYIVVGDKMMTINANESGEVTSIYDGNTRYIRLDNSLRKLEEEWEKYGVYFY